MPRKKEEPFRKLLTSAFNEKTTISIGLKSKENLHEIIIVSIIIDKTIIIAKYTGREVQKYVYFDLNEVETISTKEPLTLE